MWLIKILPIGYVILRLEPFVGRLLSCFDHLIIYDIGLPRLFQSLHSERKEVLLDSGILFYIIMACGKRGNQPQPSPVVAVPFDVFAAQNRSYQIRRASALVFGLAVGENLIALGSADNKGIVTAGLDTVVDLDIPFL